MGMLIPQRHEFISVKTASWSLTPGITLQGEIKLGLLVIMRGSRKFCQRGPTLTTFFLVVDRRMDPNKYHYKWAIIGPPEKRH